MFLNKPKNFKLPELIDPWTYETYGQKAWQFLDPNAVQILQSLRDWFGPAVVNNWSTGGKYKYSGFRPPQCRIGAKLSMHRFGKAFDVKFRNIEASDVRIKVKELIRHAHNEFCLIGAIENKVPWFHFDVRSRTDASTLWFNP